jgi:hypothetical protein
MNSASESEKPLQGLRTDAVEWLRPLRSGREQSETASQFQPGISMLGFRVQHRPLIVHVANLHIALLANVRYHRICYSALVQQKDNPAAPGQPGWQPPVRVHITPPRSWNCGVLTG